MPLIHQVYFFLFLNKICFQCNKIICFLGQTQPSAQNLAKSEIPVEAPLPSGVSPEDLKVSELDYKDKQLIKKLEKEFEEKMKEKERKAKGILPDPSVKFKQSEEQSKEIKHAEKKESKPERPVAKKFQPKIQTVSTINPFKKLFKASCKQINTNFCS